MKTCFGDKPLSLVFSQMTARLLVGALLLSTTVACQKKCQQNATRYKSVTETQWRLVETTDNSVAPELDNFNFLIVQFASNGSGSVQRVVSNEMFETPIASLLWVPNTAAKQLRIQYTSVPADEQTQPQQGDLGTFDYLYSLGKELELIDNKSGFYYRYVPFTGVVAPDIDCQF